MVIFNNTILSPGSNANTITIKAPYPKSPYDIGNYIAGDISNCVFAKPNTKANFGAWTIPTTNKK